MVAFLVVVIAFFVLAVQLFVTLIEFKLTTLAGFVLVPFGLFGKTAFLAERVLGNVIASGVKVLVLAVIVGIGSTLFDSFTREFAGAAPTLEDVLAIALAALTLNGLSPSPWRGSLVSNLSFWNGQTAASRSGIWKAYPGAFALASTPWIRSTTASLRLG